MLKSILVVSMCFTMLSCGKEDAKTSTQHLSLGRTTAETNASEQINRDPQEVLYEIKNEDIQDVEVIHQTLIDVRSGKIRTYQEIYDSLEGAVYSDDIRSGLSDMMAALANVVYMCGLQSAINGSFCITNCDGDEEPIIQ